MVFASHRAFCAFLVFVAALVSGAALAPLQALATTGYYTASQAAAGKRLFDAHCAPCHMTTLKGGAGPPLTGKRFVSYLEFSHITAAQLLSFITKQMPYNAPGSLQPQEYRNILAYILQFDHYPAGAEPLSEKSVGRVKLLPYPGKS